MEELGKMMERFFGNVWFADQKTQVKAYETWKAFQTEAVQGINGMSMNERLYMFGLMERFDASASQQEKLVVYGKLHASPNK